MKNILLTLALIVILATSLSGAVSAEDGVTFVYPFEDGTTVTVPAGDSITLQWAWLSTTRGLVHTFLRSWTADYMIYDAAGNAVFALPAVQADSIWGPIEQIDPADEAIECKGPNHWRSMWERGGISLPPGEYTLVTRWVQSRPVNDGWHTCIDTNTGEPLAYPPSLYRPGSGAWAVNIVVE